MKRYPFTPPAIYDLNILTLIPFDMIADIYRLIDERPLPRGGSLDNPYAI
jgi:hypothetical protein